MRSRGGAAARGLLAATLLIGGLAATCRPAEAGDVKAGVDLFVDATTDEVTFLDNGTNAFPGPVGIGTATNLPYLNGWGCAGGEIAWTDTTTQDVLFMDCDGLDVLVSNGVANENGTKTGDVTLTASPLLGLVLRLNYGLGKSDYLATIFINNGTEFTVSGCAGIGFPDLRTVQPGVSKTTLLTNEPFTASARVVNQNNGTCQKSTLTYYYSANATISGADTAIGTDPVKALGSGESSEEDAVVNAPPTPGTWYVGGCVAPVTGEVILLNQCSAGVEVTVEAECDLVVESPMVSAARPAAGGTFTLSATVRNAGVGTCDESTLRYYVSTDSDVSPADTELGTDGVGALGPDETSPEDRLVVAPTTLGSHWVAACVDVAANESVSDNQCSPAVPVTVLADCSEVTRASQEIGSMETVQACGQLTAGPDLDLTASLGIGLWAGETVVFDEDTSVATDADLTVGTCGMDLCAAGGLPSSASCMPCVESICLFSPQCCDTLWDAACVGQLSLLCTLACPAQ